jgi:ATP-binding cassette subfamily B protein
MNTTLSMYLERLEPAPCSAAAQTSRVGRPAANFHQALGLAGLLRYALGVIVAHGLETGTLLAGWACIGAGALSGRLDPGWLAAWALSLVSLAPLRAAGTWMQGILVIGCSGLIKQRLLIGALALESETVHQRGCGVITSEVLESESIDDLGARGAIAAVLAFTELVVTPMLFIYSANGLAQIAVLMACTTLTAWLWTRNFRLRIEWSRQRVALTQRLVENMTAHRTRVAQQSPECWHTADDVALDAYATASQRLDRSSAAILAVVPRGYVFVACLTLMPTFLAGGATLSRLAISLGAILFAANALQRLCDGLSRSAAAFAAWRIVSPIFAAGRRTVPDAVAAPPDSRARHVLEAHNITFQYPNQRESVLQGCGVAIERGERILIEGASGSGKSTFASILAGARSATGGYVLSAGLDRQTLGDAAWRKRIALAPQYHENHIVSGSVLFNLLLARDYPHTPQDIEEAFAICQELGLGGLLERMPAGLNQMVGDTGWRLSQGERSRLFLARALLQRADVVVLDECLAALDPENLRQCLQCILRRAPTLIVIAHP